MSSRIRVIPIRKEPPDLESYVAVLLALAVARVQAEREATQEPAENQDD